MPRVINTIAEGTPRIYVAVYTERVDGDWDLSAVFMDETFEHYNCHSQANGSECFSQDYAYMVMEALFCNVRLMPFNRLADVPEVLSHDQISE